MLQPFYLAPKEYRLESYFKCADKRVGEMSRAKSLNHLIFWGL